MRMASRPAGKAIAILAAMLLLLTMLPAPANAQEEDNNGGGSGVGIGISIDIMSLLKKKKKKKAAATNPAPAKKSPAVAASSGVPPKGETRFRRAEVLFILKPAERAEALAAITQAQNLERIAEAGLNLMRRTVHRYAIADGRSVARVVAALEADARIEQAQPNYLYELSEMMQAAPAALQYANVQLRIEEAHRLATGRSVLVAVIDSRVDTAHPALAESVRETYSAFDSPAPEPDTHGTAMAGAIAGRGQILGTAPGAALLVAECFARDESGKMNGSTFHILKCIDWAHGRAAKIYNMSFAGPRDPMLSRLMKDAAGQGAVFVAAAGNAGANSPPQFPAADENAIAVTAVDEQQRLYKRAVRGKHVAIAAPGVDVVVLAPDNSVGLSTGTSVATAHVAGLAALASEKTGGLDRDRLRKLLAGSARKIKAPRNSIGAGLADALRLVQDAAALAPPSTVQQ